MHFDAQTQHHSAPSSGGPAQRESAFGSNGQRRVFPTQPARVCSVCDTTLWPNSKFCWSCGLPVPGDARADCEPPGEPIVARAPSPRPVTSLVTGPNGPRVDLSDLDGDIPPPSNIDLDYLDSQLGLMAPGSRPESTPKAPTRALERPLAVASEARPDSPEAPRTPDSAVLPSYTRAQLELLSHVRVVEWLLAGNLLALVALLLKV